MSESAVVKFSPFFQQSPVRRYTYSHLRSSPPLLTSPNFSCYNQRGGGNSSTGRAPDCGSDGCGFDSRFPPQSFSSLRLANPTCEVTAQDSSRLNQSSAIIPGGISSAA